MISTMETLAERLKYVLYKLDINQVEAARLSGISQQSINYILRNNLNTSRLAVKIAEGLGINPEWLLTGKGEMRPERIHKIPIIDDYLILQLYFRGSELARDTQYVLSNRDLSNRPFAVRTEINKLCICTRFDDHSNNTTPDNVYLTEAYLYIDEEDIRLTEKDQSKQKNVYKIVEWRIYDVAI